MAVEVAVEVTMIGILLILLQYTNVIAQTIDDERIDLSHFGRRIYGRPIAFNAQTYNQKYGNPEERGPYVEGDLLILPTAKNGMKLESLRWKNRQIPYEIRGRFSASMKFILLVFVLIV